MLYEVITPVVSVSSRIYFAINTDYLRLQGRIHRNVITSYSIHYTKLYDHGIFDDINQNLHQFSRIGFYLNITV